MIKEKEDREAHIAKAKLQIGKTEKVTSNTDLVIESKRPDTNLRILNPQKKRKIKAKVIKKKPKEDDDE
jgi:hypothetical protein